jgi:hypothetical protein
MPVGCVAAYRNVASVAGAGYDIGCGNCAIRTGLAFESIAERLPAIADEMAATISFGIGRSNHADDAPTDDPLFEDVAWEAIPDNAHFVTRDRRVANWGVAIHHSNSGRGAGYGPAQKTIRYFLQENLLVGDSLARHSCSY